MFYIVKISKSDSNYLRFLWFPDNDLNKEPIQYILKVHVLGGKSSPSCSNYALRFTVQRSNITVGDGIQS